MSTHSSSYLLILMFALSLLAFAPLAFAVDGVVLINQATSTNGLPGCAHAGFPIIICKSGSYRLSGNLTVSAINTDAIDINAGNVTIDLNGFTISGPASCVTGTYPVQCSNVGSGIGISSHADFNTVRNGTVRGFGGGVILTATAAMIDGVRAESNSDSTSAGILVFDGLVIHCVATTNAGSGITGGLATVSLNSASYNGAFGFRLGATVNDNTALRNGQDGINSALSVIHNASFGNIGWGIVNNSSQAGYLGNIVGGNGLGTIFGGVSLGQNLCSGAPC